MTPHTAAYFFPVVYTYLQLLLSFIHLSPSLTRTLFHQLIPIRKPIKTQYANPLYMTSAENIEKRLEELERDYTDLLERIRDLELQVAQLTERNLRQSCSTCSLQ